MNSHNEIPALTYAQRCYCASARCRLLIALGCCGLALLASYWVIN